MISSVVYLWVTRRCACIPPAGLTAIALIRTLTGCLLPAMFAAPATAQRAKVLPIRPIRRSSVAPAPLSPMKFRGRYYASPFTVSVAELRHPTDASNPDRTGWPSILGMPNGLNGGLSGFSFDWREVTGTIGLDGLFGDRVNRHTIVADFDGDGIPDVVANTYTSSRDPFSHLMLYRGQPDGTFVEDTAFTIAFAGVRGNGETIVVADFNGDGALDIFVPYYTFPSGDPAAPTASQCILLLNDGAGNFVEAADAAGIACRFESNSPYVPHPVLPGRNKLPVIPGQPPLQPTEAAGRLDLGLRYWQPEGAQAVDFDGDGKIDLYVASRLFINQGNRAVQIGGRTWSVPTFVDKSVGYGLRNMSTDVLGQFRSTDGAFNQWQAAHFYWNDVINDGTRNVSGLTRYGPMFFDEGAKFVDWSHDGTLSLVLHDSDIFGPVLFAFNQATGKFTWTQSAVQPSTGLMVPVFNTGAPNYYPIDQFFSGSLGTAYLFGNSYGLNAYDLDNDGNEEILTGGPAGSATDATSNWIFRNTGYDFELMNGSDYFGGVVNLAGPVNLPGGRAGMALGDINNDGLIDILYPDSERGVLYYENKTANAGHSFTVEVVGPNGEKNQQGRVAHITPLVPNPPIYTRVVESGSGYMAQNQYGLLVGTPYYVDTSGAPVLHLVTVVFLDPTSATPVTVAASIAPAADNRAGLRIYAPSTQFPKGRWELYTLPGPATQAVPPMDTIGLYRASEKNFYLNTQNAPQNADIQFGFNAPPDAAIPLSGDWTGTGTTGTGLYSATTNRFFLRSSNTPGAADITTLFQPEDDVPLVGEWTHQGVSTVGVYRLRDHTFYLRDSNSTGEADLVVPFGTDGDVPLAGDWDGDGLATIGVYRPGNGSFYLRNSNTPGGPDIAVAFGMIGDVPVVGDWDGDGITTIGVYRPSNQTFYLSNSNTAPHADIVVRPSFALPRDRPVVGDWDNSGRTSIGVYRPGESVWFLQTAGGVVSFRYGNRTDSTGGEAPSGGLVDVPLVGRWVAGQGSTVAIYRNRERQFYLLHANGAGDADEVFRYTPNAPTDDVPLVGDWLGQGRTALGVYRPSNATFYLSNDNTALNADTEAYITDPTGAVITGIPVAGDWTARGTTGIGLYDPTRQTFYLRNGGGAGPYDLSVNVSGIAADGDIPISGNWASALSGSAFTAGVSTVGLYRPATNTVILFTANARFRYERTTNPLGYQVIEFGFGAPGDLPITGHWSP